MTVPAPDALRAEIDAREAVADSWQAIHPASPAAAERKAYLAAFRAILDDHDPVTGRCTRCITRYCPSYAAVAAALTRED